MSDMKLIMENWDQFVTEETGPHFDTTTGAPLTEKGRELCAKNPECREKHLTAWENDDGDIQLRPLRQDPNKLSFEERAALAQRLRKMWFNFSKELQDLGDHKDSNVAELVNMMRQSDQHVQYGLRLGKILDMIAQQNKG